MKAVIQGEFHTSSTDRELLDSHLDADVDALFLEQREDRVSPDEWSVGYLSFLIGVLILYWLQASLNDEPDIKEKAKVPVHDKIDTNLPILYSRFPRIWILSLGILSGFFFAAGLFVPLFPVPFIDEPMIVTILFTVLIKPIIVIGAVFLFSLSLIYFEERLLGTRDQNMAREINRISKQNGYETVVVSCGNAHLYQLSDLLEEKGWETDVNESGHGRIAKVWRFLDRVWGKDR